AIAVSTALSIIDSDVVIMVDGDGSYPAQGATLLLQEYLRTGADMINGIRSADEAGIFRPMHQWGMGLFASAIELTFGKKTYDLFSGLRLFSRRYYKNVPIISRGFELEIELTIQTIDKGFRFQEVSIPFRTRAAGSSSKLKTVRDGTRILRFLFLLLRDYRPMAFFGFFALAGLLMGLLAGSVPVTEYFHTGYVGHFPLAFLAASIISLSVCVFMVGLVLESNLRHHREAYQLQLRQFAGHRNHSLSRTEASR
ncbi:MAG: hypothetical protein QM796_22990, partial [Chthoniobacteraceae bacterium]